MSGAPTLLPPPAQVQEPSEGCLGRRPLRLAKTALCDALRCSAMLRRGRGTRSSDVTAVAFSSACTAP